MTETVILVMIAISVVAILGALTLWIVIRMKLPEIPRINPGDIVRPVDTDRTALVIRVNDTVAWVKEAERDHIRSYRIDQLELVASVRLTHSAPELEGSGDWNPSRYKK